MTPDHIMRSAPGSFTARAFTTRLAHVGCEILCFFGRAVRCRQFFGRRYIVEVRELYAEKLYQPQPPGQTHLNSFRRFKAAESSLETLWMGKECV